MTISPTPWPDLPAGDRAPIRKRTFAFHVNQLTVLNDALRAANAAGPHDQTLNTNTTSNALIRIAQAYLDQR